MTAYNPAEIERLVREAMARRARLQAIRAAVSGDSQMIDAMADQLEAARAEIDHIKRAAKDQAGRDRSLIGALENYVDQKPSRETAIAERDAALADLARLRSELDTANTARSLAEVRANNLDASHAARDKVKLRVSSRLGLPAQATQEEIAEAVDTLEGVRQREADAAVAWETKCDDARAKVATLEAQLDSMRPVLDAVIAWHLRSPLAFSHIAPEDLHAAMERLMAKARGVDSSTSATIGHHPRPTHFVVIAREQHVTVTPFYDAPSAIAFADDTGAQWSETYVAAIIKGPLV